MKTFNELLQASWDKKNFLCIGLDSDVKKIPKAVLRGKTITEAIFNFNQAIIEATHDLVCAYKPNSAYYEALGSEGIQALYKTVQFLKSSHPGIPIILDAKRADIGSTNEGYIGYAFDYLQVDAITVHPYLGKEALEPFLARKEKGIIVLVKTSNPGAGEFQDLEVTSMGKPLYQIIAEHVVKGWNSNNNCAVVVGATYPEELQIVRKIAGDIPILLPGIGAQGGDLEKTVAAGKNSKNQGMIINCARSIIFASKEKDFAEKAREEALKIDTEIKKYLLK